MTKLGPGREPAPQLRDIPSTVTSVDIANGDAKTEPMNWKLMPPAAHKCQVCAVEHDPLNPHDQQSLYYQLAFHAATGRNPTWADAMAHCTADLQATWRHHLTTHESGNQWSEPEDGAAPIAHLGDKT